MKEKHTPINSAGTESPRELYDALVAAHSIRIKQKNNFELMLRPLLGYFILALDDVENELDTIISNKIFSDFKGTEPLRNENLMLVLNELSLSRKVRLISTMCEKQRPKTLAKTLELSRQLDGFRNRLAHPRLVRNKMKVTFKVRNKELNAFEEEGVKAIGEALLALRAGMAELFPETKQYFYDLVKAAGVDLKEAYKLALQLDTDSRML